MGSNARLCESVHVEGAYGYFMGIHVGRTVPLCGLSVWVVLSCSVVIVGAGRRMPHFSLNYRVALLQFGGGLMGWLGLPIVSSIAPLKLVYQQQSSPFHWLCFTVQEFGQLLNDTFSGS